jgi:hypothetical protein
MIDPCGSIKGVKEPGEHHSTLHFLKLFCVFLSNAEWVILMLLEKITDRNTEMVGNRIQEFKKNCL